MNRGFRRCDRAGRCRGCNDAEDGCVDALLASSALYAGNDEGEGPTHTMRDEVSCNKTYEKALTNQCDAGMIACLRQTVLLVVIRWCFKNTKNE